MSRSVRLQITIGFLLFLFLLLPVPSPVLADTEDEEEQEEDAADLDRVEVTATRRAAGADEVPVAVTAVSGEDIDAAGIRDTQGLQALAPSLNVSVSTDEARAGVIRIRGVGTTGGANPGLEPAVGVFVDGVYRPRAGSALGDLVDIDRVEVLRGPQGTLFGKNTSAGSIMVETRKPNFTNQLDSWAQFGNRDALLLGSTFNGVVVDEQLAIRATVQKHEKDGFLTNLAGTDLNDRDRWLARAQALYTPTRDLSLRVIADYAEKDENCCGAPYTQFGPTAPVLEALGGTVFDPPRERTVAIDRPPEQNDEEYGFSAHLDWEISGDTTLQAILAHRRWEADTPGDVDLSDVDIAFFDRNEIESSFNSAELTLSGQQGIVDWMVGAYYGDEDNDADGALLFGSDAGAYFSGLAGGAVPPALYPEGGGHDLRRFDQSSRFWSVFTHNIIELDNGWELFGGARYLNESKRGGGVVLAENSPSCGIPDVPPALQILCPAPEYQAQYDDSRLIGTAGVNRRFDNGAMAYLSYSTGFKSGGINLDPTASLGEDAGLKFDPETVESWEAGLSFSLFDGRMNNRVTFFHSDFDDYQINVFDGVSFTVSNEASATTKGVELGTNWRISNAWRLSGGVTYADARFGDDTTSENLRGKRLTNSAEWSGNLGLHVFQPLDLWQSNLFGNVTVYGQSETNTGGNLDPNKRQGGYALVNARLGLRFPNQLEVALWGNNLTDRTVSQVIIDSVVQNGSFNAFIREPRTYGISLRKRFF